MRFPITRFRMARYHTGTAAIEFAIVCPLVILFGLACSDFGRISRHYQLLANAARSGAAYGATRRFTTFTRQAWEDKVRETVLLEVANISGFDESKLTYSLVTSHDADESLVIAVDLEYPFSTLIDWQLLPRTTELRTHIEFQQFQ